MATLPFFLCAAASLEKLYTKTYFCYGTGTAFVLTFRRFSANFSGSKKFQPN
jgi:hypothetical protein